MSTINGIFPEGVVLGFWNFAWGFNSQKQCDLGWTKLFVEPPCPMGAIFSFFFKNGTCLESPEIAKRLIKKNDFSCTPSPRHVCQKMSAGVDGGLSKWSSVCRAGRSVVRTLVCPGLDSWHVSFRVSCYKLFHGRNQSCYCHRPHFPKVHALFHWQSSLNEYNLDCYKGLINWKAS